METLVGLPSMSGGEARAAGGAAAAMEGPRFVHTEMAVQDDLLSIQEAPTFYPTEDEFRHPIKYISSIRHIAEPCGMCKIVPPPSFRPPFAIDKRSFRFRTRLQAINELRERTSGQGQQAFRESYGRFLSEREQLDSKAPALGWPCYETGEDVDLCLLYHAVKRRGGRDFVEAGNGWREVGALVFGQRALAGSLAGNARHLYDRYLYEYEQWAMRGKKLEASEASPQYGHRLKRRRRVPEHKTDPSMHDKQVCEKCALGCHGDVMVLCDRCDSGYHLYCLSPPLEEIPEGTWFCPECICSTQDSFGFLEGKEYDLHEFSTMANRFKADWFGGADQARRVSPEAMEREFWNIIARPLQPVLVAYGADLDTATYGSGFPTPEACPEYGNHPWNVNNFPKFDGSLLQNVDDKIPGVMVPWLYIGMLFSSFCWHHEDHNFYSVNYHHWGDIKTWYGVPGADAEAFERVMRAAVPELFELQPDLLFQLVTMLPPGEFKRNGVPIYRLNQKEGEFVITFPRAYHAGFNQGLNCAEAVNFAPGDWLPYGALSIERYRKFHKNAIISHEELVCVAAQNDVWPEAAPWLEQELRRLVAEERLARERVWAQGTRSAARLPRHREPDRISSEEDPQCTVCRFYLYLSAVLCSCSPHGLVCLNHAERLCDCSAKKRTMLYRFSLLELENLIDKVASVAPKLEPDDCRLDRSPSSVVDGLDGAPEASARPQLPVKTEGVTACLPLGPVLKEQGALDEKRTKRAASWLSAAASWAKRAEAALAVPAEVKELQQLSEAAADFLWGGREVAAVHELLPKVQEALAWGQNIARFDPAGGSVAGLYATAGYGRGEFPRKPPLSLLKELLARPGPPPVRCDFYEGLRMSCPQYEELERRLLAVLEAVPNLDAKTVASAIPDISKLPVEIPAARALKQLVAASQSWADAVRKLLPMSKAVRLRPQAELPPLERLVALMAEARGLPRRQIELATLEAAIAKASAWREKVVAVCGAEWQERAAAGEEVGWPGVATVLALLCQLELLLEDILQLPVRMPETAALQGHVDFARDWVKEAERVVVAKAELPELRDVLRRGIPIIHRAGVPEFAELRRYVQIKEWTAHVEATSSGPFVKPSKATIVRLLEAAMTLPPRPEKPRLPIVATSELALIEELHGRLAAAAAWQARAAEVLAAAPRAVPLDVYHCLIRDAKLVPVQLDDAAKLTEEVMRAKVWLERAQPFIRKHSRRQASASATATLPSLGELEQLVADLEVLRPQIKEEDAVKERLERARKWRDVAAALILQVDGDSRGIMAQPGDRGAAEALQALLDKSRDLLNEADDLGVDLPEYDALQALMANLNWQKRALEVLRAGNEASDCTVDEFGGLLSQASSVAGAEGSAMLAALEELAAEVKDWTARAALLLQARSAAEAAGGAAARRRRRQASLDCAPSVLDAGSEDGDDTRDGLSANVALTEADLRALIAKGEVMPLALPELPHLRQVLSQHQAWRKRVGAVQASGVLLVGDVVRLRAEAEQIGLSSPERRWLDEARGAVVTWEESCRRSVVRGRALSAAVCSTATGGGTGRAAVGDAGLEDALDEMLASVAVALNRVTQCFGADPREQLGTSAAEPLVEAMSVCVEQASLVHYCVCQVSGDDVLGSMVACDSCGDWYHVRCVGLSQQEAVAAQRYKCPFCATAAGEPFSLGDTGGLRQRKTRRPPMATLLQLQADARALPCVVPEAELLDAIVQGATLLAATFGAFVQKSARDPFWTPQHCATGDAAPGSKRSSGLRSVEDEWMQNLAQVVKMAIALEVDLEEAQALTALLNSFKWRRRANRTLAGRPTVRVLADLRRDGMKDPGVAPDDVLLLEVTEREKAARTWMVRARDVAADGGAAPLAEVEALLAEGDSIPVSMEREVEALRERSQLHCICRQPYDEERAMIACDKCDVWYHYDCVGVDEEEREGGDGAGAGAGQQKEFLCPSCAPDEYSALPGGGYRKVRPMEAGPDEPECSYRVEDGNQEPRVFDIDLNAVEAYEEADDGGPHAAAAGTLICIDISDDIGSDNQRRRVRVREDDEASSEEASERETSRQRLSDGPVQVSSSGRPCRRTAGKNSMLDDFVLLPLGAKSSRRASA